MLAVTAVRSFVATQPSIEVTSTESILLSYLFITSPENLTTLTTQELDDIRR